MPISSGQRLAEDWPFICLHQMKACVIVADWPSISSLLAAVCPSVKLRRCVTHPTFHVAQRLSRQAGVSSECLRFFLPWKKFSFSAPGDGEDLYVQVDVCT